MEHKIRIKTLTPVHIGNGKELQHNLDYLQFEKENAIAVTDFNKLLPLFGNAGIEEWMQLIAENRSLKEALLLKYPALSSGDVASRLITTIGDKPDKRNVVKEQFFSHAEKKATIPGSSLRGAIRSALLAQIMYLEPDFVGEQKHLGFWKGNQFVYKDAQVIAHYFGGDISRRTGEIEPSPNKDILRFLRVGDFYFEAATICIKQNIINLTNYGWGKKDSEVSFIECIPAEVQSVGRIQIPEKTIEMVKNRNYISNEKKLEHIDIAAIFKHCTQQTWSLVKDEIEFWEIEKNISATDEYLSVLEKIETEINTCAANETVLRIGAGSGWDYMTGGWASPIAAIVHQQDWIGIKRQSRKGGYPDDLMFPKTRKLLYKGEPLGFIKLIIEK